MLLFETLGFVYKMFIEYRKYFLLNVGFHMDQGDFSLFILNKPMTLLCRALVLALSRQFATSAALHGIPHLEEFPLSNTALTKSI